ncbi:MAG: hypothetical protein LBR87_02595 [Synergistaceae bacterium]|jgi:hypothetical protein|nr:hypothetical protein [Synergistaceae bacterium]
MIRIRSAFLIVLVAIILAFAIGLQAGYFSARSATLVQGIGRWVEEIKGSAQSVTGAGNGGGQ